MRNKNKKKSLKDQKRYKVCLNCKKCFIDNTKRLSKNTCSKQCHYNYGVFVRKQNNSYKRTLEQNQKMIQSFNKLREEGKLAPMSLEQRQKNSEFMKQYWASGIVKEKITKTCLEKYGVEHYTQTEEFRKQSSQLHKGRIRSPETLIKMSINSQKQKHRFSYCRGGFREDLQKYFRSSWEANFARLLNYLKLDWEYETETFQLNDFQTYTPDFKLKNGCYIELKGWMHPRAEQKLSLFKNKYKNVRLILIERKKYIKIYNKYKNLIKNWEMVHA